MAIIRRFEDIQAWQKARELVRAVYDASGKGSFQCDYALRDQIRRAAISCMSNIAEGFARRTLKEFTNFLNFAHGSVAEVQSQLYVALDQGYLFQTCFDTLYHLAEEVSKMAQGFMNYLKTAPHSRTPHSRTPNSIVSR